MKADTPTRKIGILGVGSIGQSLARAVGRRISTRNWSRYRIKPRKGRGFCGLPFQSPSRSPDRRVDRARRTDRRSRQPGRSARIRSHGACPSTRHADHERRRIAGARGVVSRSGEKGCRIYIPSGAIAGLDGIQSASMGPLESAVLTSRKPIAALAGTQFVLDRGVQLHSFKQETVIFEGSAEEAARAFPTTSNVAATLRLAIARALPVRVRVVAVPGGSKNVHEIEVQGEFGRLSVSVENVPSTVNPRTSQLAVFSAIATLRSLTRSVRVGT